MQAALIRKIEQIAFAAWEVWPTPHQFRLIGDQTLQGLDLSTCDSDSSSV
jgi:hypothetical protein